MDTPPQTVAPRRTSPANAKRVSGTSSTASSSTSRPSSATSSRSSRASRSANSSGRRGSHCATCRSSGGASGYPTLGIGKLCSARATVDRSLRCLAVESAAAPVRTSRRCLYSSIETAPSANRRSRMVSAFSHGASCRCRSDRILSPPASRVCSRGAARPHFVPTVARSHERASSHLADKNPLEQAPATPPTETARPRSKDRPATIRRPPSHRPGTARPRPGDRPDSPAERDLSGFGRSLYPPNAVAGYSGRPNPDTSGGGRRAAGHWPALSGWPGR